MDFRMKKDPPLKEGRRSRAERIENVTFLRYSLYPFNEKSSRKVARSQSLKEGSTLKRFQNARQGGNGRIQENIDECFEKLAKEASFLFERR
jgi:hypothetical protein